jgi:DNA-binding transcriptional ArsR family regulator
VTAAAPVRRRYELRLGPPDTMAVSIAIFPQQSVLALLLLAMPGWSNDGVARSRAAMRGALRPSALFAAESFASCGDTILPESCTPIPPLTDVRVAEQAERLRDLPPDVLIGELEALDRDHSLPASWRSAADEPRRWLASMADASIDTWAVLQPRWRAARPLFDREVRRVATAAVRGGLGALLNSLHPGITCIDGLLTVALDLDVRVDRGQRRLVLVPIIAHRGMLIASFERADVCYLCYPVRPSVPGPPPAENDALVLVLGAVRAAALRALDQPLTVNEVAAAVQCAPTTATYHLQQLAAAGLVHRERRGTSVWTIRTVRGDELVDLLAD